MALPVNEALLYQVLLLGLSSAPTSEVIDDFNLGLQLNVQKSTLTTVQNLEFIGALLDSVAARAYIPLHKFVVLSNKASAIQLSPHTDQAL